MYSPTEQPDLPERKSCRIGSRIDMRLIHIEYFLEIAEKKSITAAAKSLFVSQPALSKQMGLLEDELGIKLIKRKSRGIELTDAGIQFEKDCRRILSEFEDAKHQAIIIGRQEKIELRIGCFEGIVVDDFMKPLQAYLHEHFPKVRIKLITNEMVQNQKALAANQVDMIIEPEPIRISKNGYCEKLLTKRPSIFAYSALSPLAQLENPDWSDFSKETYLVPANTVKNGMGDFVLGQMPKLGIHDPAYELMGNMMNMFSNLRLGYGYSCMAKTALITNPDLLYRDLPDFYDMGIVASWKENHPFVGKIMENYGEPL